MPARPDAVWLPTSALTFGPAAHVTSVDPTATDWTTSNGSSAAVLSVATTFTTSQTAAFSSPLATAALAATTHATARLQLNHGRDG